MNVNEKAKNVKRGQEVENTKTTQCKNILD